MGIFHHSYDARPCGFERHKFRFERTDSKRKTSALDIQLKKEQTERALASLQELVPQFLENKENIILRDAMIQRFEYSTEAFWKYLKAYLSIEHNLSANSPREVIRTGLKTKLYSEEISKELLQILDDRNLTSHTYVEKLAESIAGRIPSYSTVMQNVMNQLSNT
jgi:nucleotidyltransferase substrate binding protein (TIGR01987 family)